jgi:hypothetical protein
MAAPTYIISKAIDPVFALVIGLSAAAVRINREEKDKGRTANQTIEAGLRYELCTSFYFLLYNSIANPLFPILLEELGFPERLKLISSSDLYSASAWSTPSISVSYKYHLLDHLHALFPPI